MAEEIKSYKQYIYKDGQFRKTSGGGGAEIRVVDVLPDLGEPNVLYVLDDGTSPTPSGGAVVDDTITIKEMTIKPSVKARKMAGIDGQYNLVAPFVSEDGRQWVPDPILYIKTNYISDNIYNQIITTDKVVLRINKLTKGISKRTSWRGARFTCRDHFYFSGEGGRGEYIGDEARDLWIKYHIIKITVEMVKQDDYGKYIEVKINLLERSLNQFNDLNSNEFTIINGLYDYCRNSQLSPAKITTGHNMGESTYDPDGDTYEEKDHKFNSRIESAETKHAVIPPEPISNLTDTGWQLFSQVDVWSLPSNQVFSINFKDANDSSYTSISNRDGVLYYSNGTTDTIVFDGNWLSDDYKAISIIDGDAVADNTLIYFITNNADQTSPEPPEPEVVTTKILHKYHQIPHFKSFKECKPTMPVWKYNIKGINNFIPADSDYRYVLDFRTRFNYKKVGDIEDFKAVAIPVWEEDGFMSYPTFGGTTPDYKEVIASPVITTLNFEDNTKLATTSKFVKELIQPSFGILADDWLDTECLHIWKKKFKNPDKYISIIPREIAYILNEEDYPVDYWMGITYKLGKFN